MKLKWKIALGLLVVIGLLFVIAGRREHQLASAANLLGQSLRQEGFKVDWSDFDFALSPDEVRRFAVITNAGRACSEWGWRAEFELMPMLSSNTALAVWQLPELDTEYRTNCRPEVAATLREHEELLDGACVAILGGSLRSEPNLRGTVTPLLPHLADFQNLARVLAVRMTFDLHEGRLSEAWTNLLAVTRLATGWQPEPAQVSQQTRLRLVTVAQSVTWEALQFPWWNDQQLLQLQCEWEGAEFWEELPETAAWSRTDLVALGRAERTSPSQVGASIKWLWDEVRQRPDFVIRGAFESIRGIAREVRYRHEGTYLEETALLKHFRDQELALREIVTNTTWAAMCSFPGTTNQVFYQGGQSSRLQCIANLQALRTASIEPGGTVVTTAARAESQRGLIVTALAIERWRKRQGAYPEDLSALVPALLSEVPVDFMDGKSLRYARADKMGFILYSVGLDCEDNGGVVKLPSQFEMPYSPARNRPGDDLLWPQPASMLERIQYQIEIRQRLEPALSWGPHLLNCGCCLPYSLPPPVNP